MPRWFPSRSLILMYHRIARVERDVWSMCVTPEHFEEHLEVLSRHRPVRLNEWKPRGWFKGSLSCAITFDDGYADNLHAACLLKRFGIPATFFVTTGYIGSGREFWWDELERVVYERVDSSPSEKHEEYLRLYNKLQPLDHQARSQVLNNFPCTNRSARESHRALTLPE